MYRIAVGCDPNAELCKRDIIAALEQWGYFGAFTQGTKVIENLLKIFLDAEFVPGCPSQIKVDQIRKLENKQNME